VNAALALLLLAPFGGAALVALARVVTGRDPARAAAGLLLLDAALAAGLLRAVGDGPPAALAFDWVPALGLGASFVGDRIGLCAAFALGLVSAASLWRRREDPPAPPAAAALALAGLAQAIVLGAELPLLAGLAALASAVAFALEPRPAGGPDEAGWVLVVRTGGALAVLAAALLVADVLGGAALPRLAAARPDERDWPLLRAAFALLAIGVALLPGAWPWSRWLGAPRAASPAGPLLALAGATLLLRCAPLVPAPVAWASLALPFAAPLVTAALGRWFARPAGRAAV